MSALAVGIAFIVFAVYSVLPVDWSLQWGPEVLMFLKGGIPILAAMIGLIAVLIGIADIKDKIEAKKEEAEEAAAEARNAAESGATQSAASEAPESAD